MSARASRAPHHTTPFHTNDYITTYISYVDSAVIDVNTNNIQPILLSINSTSSSNSSNSSGNSGGKKSRANIEFVSAGDHDR